MTGGATEVTASAGQSKDLPGQISWAMYEFARTPYVGLVFIFAFAPYFANTVVGDPVKGQEIWSMTNTIVGVCVGLLAPIIGAMADSTGRPKVWVAATVAIMTPCCLVLWYAMPATMGGPSIFTIALIIIVLTVSFEFGQVFHNSMLLSLVGKSNVGRLSGLGLAMANIGGLTSTLILLFGIALPAANDPYFSFLPNAPLFGLDTETHEHSRIVGPIAGVWLLLFSIPFFLWAPDRRGRGTPLRHALRQGLKNLHATVRQARRLSNVGRYLIARMLYNDAMVAIQAYSGIIAVGMFQWDLTALLFFSLCLSPFTILGGFVGGWLDGLMGSKFTILASIVGTGFFLIAALSMAPDRIFYIVPYDTASGPLWAFPYFQTLPEVLFLVMYMGLAMTVTTAFVSSRAMMAKISPVEMASQFFGLYAVSGWATAFLGHGLVAFFTGVFLSQKVGFAAVLVLMVPALILMSRVREERAQLAVPAAPL